VEDSAALTDEDLACLYNLTTKTLNSEVLRI
jgi:hypothetical protein